MTDYLDGNVFKDSILQMLYHDRIDIRKELILLKVATVKNVWFVIIVFLIMDSNFKILYVRIVIIWKC